MRPHAPRSPEVCAAVAGLLSAELPSAETERCGSGLEVGTAGVLLQDRTKLIKTPAAPVVWLAVHGAASGGRHASDWVRHGWFWCWCFKRATVCPPSHAYMHICT